MLPHIIHQDQNGFIFGRQLKNNITTLLNAVEFYHQFPGEKAAFIFLEAEKAFDNVKWKFILEQRLYMECGETFLHLILEIHSLQYTQILINEDLTNPLRICKGMRQGCSLSPLLFV